MEIEKKVEIALQNFIKNRLWIKKIDDELDIKMPLDDWSAHFEQVMATYRSLRAENSRIQREITSLLEEELTPSLADILFQNAEKLYKEDLDDSMFLIPIFEKLLAFYDAHKDINHCILLYSYLWYEHNIVFEFYLYDKKNDNHYLLEIFHYKDQYTTLSEEARSRFWIAYYFLIVVGGSNSHFPVDDCFRYYHDAEEFWNTPEVQALDGNNPSMLRVFKLLKFRLMVLDTYMNQASPENQAFFCKVSASYFEEDLKTHNNDLSACDILTYKAYLRSQILTGEKDLATCFDLLVSNYMEQLERMNHAVPPTDKEVAGMAHTIDAILDWSKELNNKDRLQHLITELITISETKWARIKYYHTHEVDLLLQHFMEHIMGMPFEKSEKERYLTELIIKRQHLTFYNAVLNRNITGAIYEALVKEETVLFDNIPQTVKDHLSDFIEKCSLFHNCGLAKFYICCELPYRDYLPKEAEILDTHTQVGADFIQKAPDLSEYMDVMLYHHIYYDGSNDSTPEKKSLQSPYKIITDLVAIADYIIDCTSNLLQSEPLPNCLANCFQQLIAYSGTRFHPKVIALILKDTELQDTILRIVTEDKIQILYSIHHSFDIGSSVEDYNLFFQYTLDKINASDDEKNYYECQKSVDQLFAATEYAPSPRTLGLAYYASMLLNHKRKMYVRVTHDAFLAINHLTLADDYEYLAKTYHMLGIHASYNGDFGNATTYYILCSEYAKKQELCELVSSSLHSVSSIFKGLGNYIKAIEYLEKAEAYDDSSTARACYNQCLKGYYMLKLSQPEVAHLFFDHVKKLTQETSDYPKFMAHIFMAYLLFLDGDQEASMKHLTIATKDNAHRNDYVSHMDDIDIYMEFLFQIGSYTELLEEIDYHLEQCEKNQIPFHVHQILIRKALECDKQLKKPELNILYGEKQELIFQMEETHKNDSLLQAELSVWDNISNREKQSELEQDNEKLSKGIQEAEHASSAKSTFLSSMSHEIRTPINAILGLDEMILRESKEEYTLRYATDIQTAGTSLLGLVNDILDFSKLEANKMELIYQEYQSRDFLLDLVGAIEEKTERKGLAFHFFCPENLPSTLYGDDFRLRQILHNILTNAVKYTQEGSIRFIIAMTKQSETNIDISFTVSDTGIGMKAEEMKKLAKPFERLDEKRNSTIAGTGLGMSISTSLLHMMDSKLEVESVYGEGTTFSFTLSQVVRDWTPIGSLQAPVQHLKKSTKKQASFLAPDAEILIVDDNAVNLKVISNLLKRNQVSLTLAKSGTECLELCQKKHFHLILLDHQMPDLDGIETLHRLRHMDCTNQHTPAIALTANVLPNALSFYQKEGFDEYLAKPVDSSLLEEKIQILLPKEVLLSH